MANNVTYHTTEEADILFMAVARPLKDKQTGKEEFSIKLELKDDSPTVKHLLEVSEAKVDTKTNRKLEGIKRINFSTPSKINDEAINLVVTDANGVKLEGKEIPFFDGRKDKGRAIVTYKVITYPNRTLVRLQSVKLMSIDLAPREVGMSVSELTEKLKG